MLSVREVFKARKVVWFFVIWFVALVPLDSLPLSAADLDCEIIGKLHYTSYLLDRTNQDLQFTFTVSIKGSNWLIRAVALPEERPDAVAKAIELGTDGTNAYRLVELNLAFDPGIQIRKQIQMCEQALENQGLPEKDQARYRAQKKQLEERLKEKKPALERSGNQAIGKVFPSVYPKYAPGDHTSIIWLACCSQCYLETFGSEKLPLVWASADLLRGTNDLIPVRLTREETSPGLPKAVDFLHDGTSPQFQSNRWTRQSLPAPLDASYTNAVYIVSAFTNHNGASLPLSFVFEARSPTGKAGTGVGLVPTERYEGVVTSIETPCRKTRFVPELPTQTLIQDQRIAVGLNRDKLQYIAKPGPWPTSTNVASLKGHERQLKAKIRERKKHRQMILGIAMPILLLSGVLLFFRTKKPQTTNL